MKKIVFASTVFAALCSINASATVYNAGAFSITSSVQDQKIIGGFHTPVGVFSDTIYFTLLSPETRLIRPGVMFAEDFPQLITQPRLFNYDISNFHASLYNSNNQLLAETSTRLYNGGGMAALAAGDYRLDITGNAVGLFGGVYGTAISGTLNIPLPFNRTFDAAIAPAPEPETWAMMLAGLGVVASTVRRKKAI
ncbi:MAG: FxDxF family PEP-CTERM protein [Pseudomonadota bacterium]